MYVILLFCFVSEEVALKFDDKLLRSNAAAHDITVRNKIYYQKDDACNFAVLYRFQF